MYITIGYTQNHFKKCILAPNGNSFWWKFKKMWKQGFFHYFLLQYTPNNVYWRIRTKNNVQKHEYWFFPNGPKIMQKNVKKAYIYTVGIQKHRQDEGIKIIDNKIFCSSLCTLAVGKASFLPIATSQNSLTWQWGETEYDATWRNTWNQSLRTLENRKYGCLFV